METLTQTKESNTMGMIVKRVSVPMGLEELMEGLSKEVLLKKPKDLYVFASEYFARLVNLREKSHKYKVHPVHSVQSVAYLSDPNRALSKKKPVSKQTRQTVSKQAIENTESTMKKNIFQRIGERRSRPDKTNSSTLSKSVPSRDQSRSNKVNGSASNPSSLQSTPREKRQSSITRSKRVPEDRKSQKTKTVSKKEQVKTALISPTVIGGAAVTSAALSIKPDKKDDLGNNLNTSKNGSNSTNKSKETNSEIQDKVKDKVEKSGSDKEIDTLDKESLEFPLDSDILESSTNVENISKKLILDDHEAGRLNQSSTNSSNTNNAGDEIIKLVGTDAENENFSLKSENKIEDESSKDKNEAKKQNEEDFQQEPNSPIESADKNDRKNSGEVEKHKFEISSVKDLLDSDLNKQLPKDRSMENIDYKSEITLSGSQKQYSLNNNNTLKGTMGHDEQKLDISNNLTSNEDEACEIPTTDEPAKNIQQSSVENLDKNVPTELEKSALSNNELHSISDSSKELKLANEESDTSEFTNNTKELELEQNANIINNTEIKNSEVEVDFNHSSSSKNDNSNATKTGEIDETSVDVENENILHEIGKRVGTASDNNISKLSIESKEKDTSSDILEKELIAEGKKDNDLETDTIKGGKQKNDNDDNEKKDQASSEYWIKDVLKEESYHKDKSSDNKTDSNNVIEENIESTIGEKKLKPLQDEKYEEQVSSNDDKNIIKTSEEKIKNNDGVFMAERLNENEEEKEQVALKKGIGNVNDIIKESKVEEKKQISLEDGKIRNNDITDITIDVQKKNLARKNKDSIIDNSFQSEQRDKEEQTALNSEKTSNLNTAIELKDTEVEKLSNMNHTKELKSEAEGNTENKFFEAPNSENRLCDDEQDAAGDIRTVLEPTMADTKHISSLEEQSTMINNPKDEGSQELGPNELKEIVLNNDGVSNTGKNVQSSEENLELGKREINKVLASDEPKIIVLGERKETVTEAEKKMDTSNGEKIKRSTETKESSDKGITSKSKLDDKIKNEKYVSDELKHTSSVVDSQVLPVLNEERKKDVLPEENDVARASSVTVEAKNLITSTEKEDKFGVLSNDIDLSNDKKNNSEEHKKGSAIKSKDTIIDNLCQSEHTDKEEEQRAPNSEKTSNLNTAIELKDTEVEELSEINHTKELKGEAEGNTENKFVEVSNSNDRLFDGEQDTTGDIKTVLEPIIADTKHISTVEEQITMIKNSKDECSQESEPNEVKEIVLDKDSVSNTGKNVQSSEEKGNTNNLELAKREVNKVLASDEPKIMVLGERKETVTEAENKMDTSNAEKIKRSAETKESSDKDVLPEENDVARASSVTVEAKNLITLTEKEDKLGVLSNDIDLSNEEKKINSEVQKKESAIKNKETSIDNPRQSEYIDKEEEQRALNSEKASNINTAIELKDTDAERLSKMNHTKELKSEAEGNIENKFVEAQNSKNRLFDGEQDAAEDIKTVPEPTIADTKHISSVEERITIIKNSKDEGSQESGPDEVKEIVLDKDGVSNTETNVQSSDEKGKAENLELAKREILTSDEPKIKVLGERKETFTEAERDMDTFNAEKRKRSAETKESSDKGTTNTSKLGPNKVDEKIKNEKYVSDELKHTHSVVDSQMLPVLNEERKRNVLPEKNDVAMASSVTNEGKNLITLTKKEDKISAFSNEDKKNNSVENEDLMTNKLEFAYIATKIQHEADALEKLEHTACDNQKEVQFSGEKEEKDHNLTIMNGSDKDERERLITSLKKEENFSERATDKQKKSTSPKGRKNADEVIINEPISATNIVNNTLTKSELVEHILENMEETSTYNTEKNPVSSKQGKKIVPEDQNEALQRTSAPDDRKPLTGKNEKNDKIINDINIEDEDKEKSYPKNSDDTETKEYVEEKNKISTEVKKNKLKDIKLNSAEKTNDTISAEKLEDSNTYKEQKNEVTSTEVQESINEEIKKKSINGVDAVDNKVNGHKASDKNKVAAKVIAKINFQEIKDGIRDAPGESDSIIASKEQLSLENTKDIVSGDSKKITPDNLAQIVLTESNNTSIEKEQKPIHKEKDVIYNEENQLLSEEKKHSSIEDTKSDAKENYIEEKNINGSTVQEGLKNIAMISEEILFPVKEQAVDRQHHSNQSSLVNEGIDELSSKNKISLDDTTNIVSKVSLIKNIMNSNISQENPGKIDSSIGIFLNSFLEKEQNNIFKTIPFPNDDIQSLGTEESTKQIETVENVSSHENSPNNAKNVPQSNNNISGSKIRRARSVGPTNSEQKSKIPTPARRSAGRRPLVRQLETSSKDFEKGLSRETQTSGSSESNKDSELWRKENVANETGKIKSKNADSSGNDAKEDVLIAKTILKYINNADKNTAEMKQVCSKEADENDKLKSDKDKANSEANTENNIPEYIDKNETEALENSTLDSHEEQTQGKLSKSADKTRETNSNSVASDKLNTIERGQSTEQILNISSQLEQKPDEEIKTNESKDTNLSLQTEKGNDISSPKLLKLDNDVSKNLKEEKAAIRIQSLWRGFIIRKLQKSIEPKKFNDTERGVIKIQAAVRGFLERNKIEKLKKQAALTPTSNISSSFNEISKVNSNENQENNDGFKNVYDKQSQDNELDSEETLHSNLGTKNASKIPNENHQDNSIGANEHIDEKSKNFESNEDNSINDKESSDVNTRILLKDDTNNDNHLDKNNSEDSDRAPGSKRNGLSSSLSEEAHKEDLVNPVENAELIEKSQTHNQDVFNDKSRKQSEELNISTSNVSNENSSGNTRIQINLADKDTNKDEDPKDSENHEEKYESNEREPKTVDNVNKDKNSSEYTISNNTADNDKNISNVNVNKPEFYRTDTVIEPNIVKQTVAPLGHNHEKDDNEKTSEKKDDNNNNQSKEETLLEKNVRSAVHVILNNENDTNDFPLKLEIKNTIDNIMSNQTEDHLQNTENYEDVDKIVNMVPRVPSNEILQNNSNDNKETEDKGKEPNHLVDNTNDGKTGPNIYDESTSTNHQDQNKFEDRSEKTKNKKDRASHTTLDEVCSVDSVDSVVTVVPNPKYENETERKSDKNNEKRVPNIKIFHDSNVKDDHRIDQLHDHGVSKSRSTDALEGHVDLIDQVQNTLLDQISGKSVDSASKFDIEQLRKELHEAASLYKSEDIEPQLISHNEELLDYLSDFETEEDSTYDSRIIRTPIRELPDIEEEADNKDEENDDGKKIVLENSDEHHFCGTPAFTESMTKKIIDNQPLEAHVEMIGIKNSLPKSNEEVTNDNEKQIHTMKEKSNPIDGEGLAESKGKLLNTSELHDIVVIPITSEKAGSSTVNTDGNLRHTSEFHDTVVVSLPSGTKHETKEVETTEPTISERAESVDSGNQTSIQQAPAGSETVTSPRSLQSTVVDVVEAQASLIRDTSLSKSKSVESFTHQSPPQSPRFIKQVMESENNNNNKKNNAVSSNISNSEKNMEAEAATKIQAGFRGYKVRKQLKNKNSPTDKSSQDRQLKRKTSGRKISKDSDLVEKSAVKIQAGVRGFLVRRRQKKQMNSSASA